MSSSYLTIDMVTREALRVAHETAAFLGTVDRSYDDSFAKTGGKIGSSLRIRQPNQYTVRTSGRSMDVQDTTEATTSVTVANQYGVDMKFYSDERALAIDEFSQRYIEPAVKRLVSKVESDCLATATKAVYNVVGTAGTVVGTSGDISAIHNARARLNQMLAPKDDNRNLQLDSVTMANVAANLKLLLTPAADVSKAFREGLYTRTAMADMYENERTYVHTNGTVGGSTSGSAAVTDGGSSITNDGTATVTVGAVFTVAGVFACHQETKQSLGFLQQFVITAAPGGAVMTVSPTTTLTGAKQNVCKSDSTALATTDFNTKALTFIGSSATAYRQNLMYHKEAFTFVTADLPLMTESESCVRRVQDGISLRVWQGADIINDRMLMRIDLLWGFAAIRPEFAVRVTN